MFTFCCIALWSLLRRWVHAIYNHCNRIIFGIISISIFFFICRALRGKTMRTGRDVNKNFDIRNFLSSRKHAFAKFSLTMRSNATHTALIFSLINNKFSFSLSRFSHFPHHLHDTLENNFLTFGAFIKIIAQCHFNSFYSPSHLIIVKNVH